MAIDLQPYSDETDPTERSAETGHSAFSVSSEPVIAERTARDPQEQGLPRSYGSETLCLLARDPHSLFAFWDIDWKRAFGEESPKPRKVHLRILNTDESEHTSIEVEPLAGNCSVYVRAADVAYHGEIGYFEPPGIWNSVSRSETVFVPTKSQAEREMANFATVPFHLSFQRMIDALQVGQEEDEPLTGMLSDLQNRVATADDTEGFSLQQRELARVIEEAVATQPAASNSTASPDLWPHHGLEKILGFGNSSLSGGFGGSSRD